MTADETTRRSQDFFPGGRFRFGDNWSRFLRVVDESRIKDAVDSLKAMLEVGDLQGKSFLDIGSGSGLFSLAAKRLGARVVSFDLDPRSVACTEELKRRYCEGAEDWIVQTGSALDRAYLESLGTFDIVYSWGVLHHTGALWDALDKVEGTVARHGKLFVAIYNFQPMASRYWAFVKRAYNKSLIARIFFTGVHMLYPMLPSMIARMVRGRTYPRGMSAWYDLMDWLGGYPFEVATPAEIFDFYRMRGYSLQKIRTVGGKLGCNEFVFRRSAVDRRCPYIEAQ